MASIQEMPAMSGRRAGVRRMKKHSLKTDMTPMVDLGFLLIAFFIFTTRLAEPVSVRLNMPHDGPSSTLGESNALTVWIDANEKLYYYHGDLSKALAENAITPTTLSVKEGIGNVIRQKQQWLDQAGISGDKRDGLMLLIKATSEADYRTVIDMLDEVTINNVKRYALVKMEPEETKWLSEHR